LDPPSPARGLLVAGEWPAVNIVLFSSHLLSSRSGKSVGCRVFLSYQLRAACKPPLPRGTDFSSDEISASIRTSPSHGRGITASAFSSFAMWLTWIPETLLNQPPYRPQRFFFHSFLSFRSRRFLPCFFFSLPIVLQSRRCFYVQPFYSFTPYSVGFGFSHPSFPYEQAIAMSPRSSRGHVNPPPATGDPQPFLLTYFFSPIASFFRIFCFGVLILRLLGLMGG